MSNVSKVEIINKGLVLVGAAPIVNIDDDSNNAKVAQRTYGLSLRSVLAECKWNFATKRAMLSLLTDNVAWYEPGEGYVYQKPLDMVRIFSTNSPKAVWREEGDYIISDTPGLGVRYTWFIETPGKYSAEFIDALVDKFASDVAYTLVNSLTLGEKYKALYEKVTKPKAMSVNSQTGTQQTPIDDAWDLSRFSDQHPEA